MSDIKSPYLVTRHEYVDTDSCVWQLSDEAIQHRKVVLRASRMRPASRWGILLWGFAINAVLWGLFGCFIYWIGELGFWDWIRGVFQ